VPPAHTPACARARSLQYFKHQLEKLPEILELIQLGVERGCIEQPGFAASVAKLLGSVITAYRSEVYLKACEVPRAPARAPERREPPTRVACAAERVCRWP
jgi:hypothetical protein